jgi:serine protease Do
MYSTRCWVLDRQLRLRVTVFKTSFKLTIGENFVLKRFVVVTSFVFLVFNSLAVLAQLPDFTELVEETSPAVVKINTVQKARSGKISQISPGQIPDIFRDLLQQRERSQQRPVMAMGSGFVISDDGYILTNHHVVDGADEIVVRFSDRREFNAEVVGKDRRSDLALLKIDAEDLPTLKLAEPDELKVGEWVLAIGSPFGLDYSASVGIVSAIGRSIPTEKGENYVPFIQTDVAINPGNSGGPLFNLDGEVVGINSQIYSRSGGSIGLSFAIPTSVALGVIEQLKNNGEVQRGWLGVVIQDVDKDLARSLDLDKPQGALINAVEPDSPADKGGIKPGDVIVRFDRQAIVDSGDLPHVVGMLRPGKKAQVDFYRQGKLNKMTIEIGRLDGDDSAVASNADGSDRLGLVVADLGDRERSSLGVRGGVVIDQVSPDSSAAESGLNRGDVILQLGYSRIDDTDEYDQVVRQLPVDVPVLIRFYRQGRAISRTIILRQ